MWDFVACEHADVQGIFVPVNTFAEAFVAEGCLFAAVGSRNKSVECGAEA